jgi:hypothetical protein
MSEIGNITVKIGADTYQLQKGLTDAQQKVGQFDKSTGNLGQSLQALGVVAVATATAIAAFTKQQINAMDALDEVSQRTGVAVDALSKLGYAARVEGVGIEGLQQSFVFLSRNMSEAAQGAGSALPAFNALGIAFKNNDGTLRSSEQVFLDVAERFKTMEDGAGKTALAMAVFGRSGASLIPMLNQGREGLQAYGDELEAFGGVVTPQAAAAAAQFNDNLNRLNGALASVGQSIAIQLLPSITRLSEEFLIAIKNGISFGEMLRMGLRSGNYQEQLAKIREEIEAVNKQWGLFNAPKDEQIESLRRQEKVLLDVIARTDELNAKQNMVGPPVEAIPRELAPQMVDSKKAEEDAKKLEDLKIQQAERLAVLAESFMTESQLEQLKFEQQQTQLAIALENRMISEEQYRMWLEQLENEHGARMTEIVKKNMSDSEKFRNQSLSKQAKDVAGFLQQMTASTANSSKEMFAINKAASLANGIVTAYESIMDAYKFGNKIGGPPVGAAFAAVAGAAQFAQLRAIASSQFSGAGTTAPSAIGSTAAGVTPVQAVNSAGQAQGGGGGQTVNIALQGNTFNRDQVRDLITQINEVISDGSTLRLS